MLRSLLLLSATVCLAQKSRDTIFKELMADYDASVIPTPKPRIDNQIWIQDAIQLCPERSELTIDLYTNLIWHDSRLDFAKLSDQSILKLSAGQSVQVWGPNVNFVNARSYEIASAPYPSI